MLPRGLTLIFPSFAEVNSEIPLFRRGSSSIARLRLCVGARSPFHRAGLVFGCALVHGLPFTGQVSPLVVLWCTASLSQGRPGLQLYFCLANNDNIKLLKQGGSNFHVLPELI